MTRATVAAGVALDVHAEIDARVQGAGGDYRRLHSEPGVYFSMNVKGDPAATVALVTSHGFPVTTGQMDSLAHEFGEKTLFGRTGGAATLAVGMAHIFPRLSMAAGSTSGITSPSCSRRCSS